jgi:hypothetical protein
MYVVLDGHIQYIDNYNTTEWNLSKYITHLHTNSAQNYTVKQNTQNITYITKRIHKHDNKNT